METTETNTEAAVAAESGEKTPASANIDLDQLKAMMKKRRSAPAAGGTAASRTEPKAAATGAEESNNHDPGLGESGNDLPSDDSTTAAETETETATAEETPAEETETEADADAEGEGADEADEEKDVPKAIQSMRKRIDALTKRAKTAEETNAALEARLAEGSAQKETKVIPQEGAEGVDPRFARDAGLVKLTRDLAEAESILTWTEEALASGEESFELNGQTFNQAQVRSLRRTAEGERATLAAKRAAREEALEGQFAEQERAFYAEASDAYPWIKDKTTEEYGKAVAMLTNHAVLKQMPNRLLIIGDLIAGEKMRLAAAAKKVAPAMTRKVLPGNKPAPVPTQRGAAAPKVDGKKVKVSAAEDKFKSSGRAGDLTGLLRARREAARAAA